MGFFKHKIVDSNTKDKFNLENCQKKIGGQKRKRRVCSLQNFKKLQEFGKK